MPVHAGARGNYSQEGAHPYQYGATHSNFPSKAYGHSNGQDRLAYTYNGQGQYGTSPHANGRHRNGAHTMDGPGRGSSPGVRHSSYFPPNSANNGPQFESGMGPTRNQRPVSDGYRLAEDSAGLDGVNTDYFRHTDQQSGSNKNTAKSSKSQTLEQSYSVMHLTTLSMDRKEGIMNIDDAMRKLKLLDAKGKIWAQAVTLKIYTKEIVLVDNYSQDTIESLPLGDLSVVSSEMNQSQYKNLMLLVFQFSAKKPQEVFFFSCEGTPFSAKKPKEVFFFSCEGTPAPEIVQQVKRAAEYATGKKKKTKKSPPSSGRGSSVDSAMVPPPPQEPAPPPPETAVKNKVAQFAAVAAANQAGGAPQSPSSVVPRADRVDSIEALAARTERDVELLNKCFDEIEFFIQRLQKAAEAYVELSNRRRNRKSKGQEPGEGLLLARSKPPSNPEYIACYQMFKFSINLLAKLKNHIHDPNAPELVHFLFIPLKLVVDGSQGPGLARTIESPLLTPQGIDLLTNCLTSREADLWHSLGPAWNIPSTEWPKDKPVARFVPQFRDGWTPPPVSHTEQVPPDINKQLAVNAGVAAQAAQAAAKHEKRRSVVPSEGVDSVDYPYSDGRSSNNSGPSSPRHNEPPPQVRPKPSPPVATTPVHQASGQARASYDFVARNPKELTIMAGEILDVLDSKRKWWEVRNSSGQSGFVPSTILEMMHPHVGSNPNSNHSNSSFENRPASPATSSQSRGELGVGSVEVHAPPQNHVPPPPPVAPAPPPPPPPPPPAVVEPPGKLNITKSSQPPQQQQLGLGGSDFHSELTSTVRRKQQQRQQTGVDGVFPQDIQNNNRSPSNMDALNAELLSRVSGVNGPKKNFKVVKKSGPATPLTHDSSPAEVTEWLNSKGFNKMTVSSLGVLTGAQLFSLTKDELQQVCHNDGSRVYSQLMVQKSTLQAMEGSGTSREFKAIMQRRKVRSAADESLGAPPDFDPDLPSGGT